MKKTFKILFLFVGLHLQASDAGVTDRSTCTTPTDTVRLNMASLNLLFTEVDDIYSQLNVDVPSDTSIWCIKKRTNRYYDGGVSWLNGCFDSVKKLDEAIVHDFKNKAQCRVKKFRSLQRYYSDPLRKKQYEQTLYPYLGRVIVSLVATFDLFDR